MWKYCGKISQLGFFILSFHSPPHTCPLSPFFYFFFSFSPSNPSSNISFAPLFLQKKKKNCSSHWRKDRDRDREKGERLGEIGLASTACISTAAPASPPSGWVRSACFFFFFSYLLVLIQIYFKNWILFCGLCLD